MLVWESDLRIVVDGTHFSLDGSDLSAARAANGAGVLLAHKPRWMVERYLELQSQIAPTNVFELGIYEGGSAALLSLLFHPRRHVAIDIEQTRVPELDDFIDRQDLHDTVHAYYGVDQADRARLEEIVREEFGPESLDIVIDDASHLLHETTASFNVLFPRLRPGGLFVIEDWSWFNEIESSLAHQIDADADAKQALRDRLDRGEVAAPEDEGLSRLVLELVLTAAYDEHIVAEVSSLRRGWLVVRRGDAPLDPNTFDISQAYGALGRAMLNERRPARHVDR